MRELELSCLVPATALARKGFYALGRSNVYTNNYRNCHTVKAYRTGSLNRDLEILSSIVNFLSKSGYSSVSSGMTKRAIIIRIPK